MASIQVEDLSTVKKKIVFEVPENEVLNIMDAEYRNLKKTVQIKGFRKGKAPLNIIRSYFKSKVEADAARKIIEETFESGLDEQNIKPVSVISIDPENVQAGKPFKYTAHVEVTPALEIKDYKGMRLRKQQRLVTPKDVAKRIEDLRESNAKLVPIPETRSVRIGDYLLVDIEAEADGERIPPLSVKDYHLELGRNFYLPDFDVRLEGMKPDQTKEIVIEFEEDFVRKNLSGKTGTFVVTCKEAKERLLPELDNDFAKDLGGFASLESLRESVKKELEELAAQETKQAMENQIIDELIEKNPFEVPDSMVENEIDRIFSQLLQNYAAQRIDPKRIPLPSQAQRDQVRARATRDVKTRLVLNSIISRELIEISDEEMQVGIKKQAEKLGVSLEYFNEQFTENEISDWFRTGLLFEKAFKFIEAHAETTEVGPPQQTENAESSTIEG